MKNKKLNMKGAILIAAITISLILSIAAVAVSYKSQLNFRDSQAAAISYESRDSAFWARIDTLEKYRKSALKNDSIISTYAVTTRALLLKKARADSIYRASQEEQE